MKIKSIEELFVTVQIDCEKHGKVEITSMKGKKEYHCKYCQIEQKTKQEQDEKERQEKITNERMIIAKQIKILKRIDNPTPLPKDTDYFKSDWFANAVLQNGYVSLNLFKQEHLDDIKKFETGYKN